MADSLLRLDSWSKVQGSPTPLGATWVDSAQAWNFALYSTEATAVHLLIYGPNDFLHPIQSFDLDARSNKTIRVWHILVPAAAVPGAAGTPGAELEGPPMLSNCLCNSAMRA